MIVLAQVGLGGVGKALTGILALIWSGTILAYVLFLILWYSPEVVQLLSDWIRGRDLLAESQLEREYEGRLFGPPAATDCSESATDRDSRRR